MLNKKCLATFGILSLTLFLGFSSLHLMQLFSVSKWIGVSIASGIFVVMLVLAIIFRKCKFISCIVIPMNGLANGIAASSLFVYLDKFPEIWHTALLFVALCILFYLYCILTKISFFQKHFVICIGIYMLILIAIGVTCLILVDKTVFALALLCLIPFFAFLILLVAQARDFFELMKVGIYCSFSVLALIIVVVLIVISEGNALDGIGDGIGDGITGGVSRGKTRNPYDYLKPLK